MRIDGALPVPENQQVQKSAGSGSSAPQGQSAPITSAEDHAQLSLDSGTVQQLTAKAAQMPEIRQERVNALRQAVGRGTYQVSDQQLADAIGSELLSAGQLRLT